MDRLAGSGSESTSMPHDLELEDRIAGEPGELLLGLPRPEAHRRAPKLERQDALPLDARARIAGQLLAEEE